VISAYIRLEWHWGIDDCSCIRTILLIITLIIIMEFIVLTAAVNGPLIIIIMIIILDLRNLTDPD